MLQNTKETPKWVIIENIVSNTSVRKCHHRDTMFIAEINHNQGVGLVDTTTKVVYNCAFNNRQFSDEVSAKKYLAKYFRDEHIALISMLKSIETFTTLNPELMI